MYLFVFLLFPALGASASTGDVTSIQTATHAVTCESFQISWAGGVAPYKLILQDAAAPEPPIQTNTITGTSLVWVPNVPAGTLVSLQVNDSSGTLAQTSSFTVQQGPDTSCVGQPPSSFAANNSSPANTVTFTRSAESSSTSAAFTSATSTVATVPPTNSSAPPSSDISSTLSKASTRNQAVIAAIVVPISVLMVLVLVFLFLRLRKRRRRGVNPFEDSGSVVDRDLPPISLNIVPFGSTSVASEYTSEKSLPAVPMRPQVTPEELQNAIDRIQEMYTIMRQQSSSTSASDNGRMLELQRQIEDLMADNAVLSGEPPPDYDSERGSSV